MRLSRFTFALMPLSQVNLSVLEIPYGGIYSEVMRRQDMRHRLPLSRRRLITGTAALAAAASFPMPAWARGSDVRHAAKGFRSEEHTSELQSLMRISYAVFCLKKKKNNKNP